MNIFIMPDEEETYCRLCAEPTSKEQLIASDDEVAIHSKIVTKMCWINVDVSLDIPNSVCFSCFDLLEKTWLFLQDVRTAQQKLYEIYNKKPELNNINVKPTSKLSKAGRPVDKHWDEFKYSGKEVKVEVPADVESKSVLEMGVIKKESNSDDGDNNDANYDSDMIYATTDSDLPLVTLNIKKKKKRKKHKKKAKVKEEVSDADLLPNPTAEAIPLDMSLCSMTWDDYIWKCANCDAEYKNLTSLRLHSIEIHLCCCVFKCTDCGKVIPNHKSFVKHVRLHNKSLRYCCEYCNKHFPIAQYIKKHCSEEHRSHLTTCQNCGANFNTQEQLQDHILAYAKGYRRSFKKKCEKDTELTCEHCSKGFKSKSNLNTHKLLHTQRSREFSCHICGKMFYTKATLINHLLVHSNIKPYKCNFCPLAFRTRGNFQSHISLHSGVKPFVCEQCGKSFRVKRHLTSHSIVHTDLMPFACKYCNKHFRFKTRLNLHLRQHTGAKPYTCIHCQRDFTNGSNYKKHMKRRHNIDTSKKIFASSIPESDTL